MNERDMEVGSAIPLARPMLGEAEMAAIGQVLRSGQLVLGQENRRFEHTLANLSGRAHAVAVSSGTTALELTVWAMGIEPGDQVLLPAASFPAAANAIVRAGAVPVPVDIDASTWTMDIRLAASSLSPRTRALISVDTFGQVAEAAELEELAHSAGLALIDDAACALGGFDSRGRAGGGYGDAGAFSFHPRKVVTTGEGGAVVCDDPELAARLRELRNQGQRERGRFARPGTNARLGELAAAMGNAQLERLERMLMERRLLVSGYHERLERLRASGKLCWQTAPAAARSAHQTFAVLLAPPLDRDRVMAHLRGGGIESGVASFSLNRLDGYATSPAVAGKQFPVAEGLHERGLALPLFCGMRSAELDRVSDALAKALQA